LKSHRRPATEFNEWRPGPFYYPYVPLGALLAFFLIGPPWLGMGHLAVTGFSFGFLCCLPFLSNPLRFWLYFRLPNARLRPRLASLEAELARQQMQHRTVVWHRLASPGRRRSPAARPTGRRSI
jgi:hypothetical protein